MCSDEASSPEELPEPTGFEDATAPVMVELRAGRSTTADDALRMARDLAPLGFEVDADYVPVPMGSASFIVSGRVTAEASIERIEAEDSVIRVWGDTPVEPF